MDKGAKAERGYPGPTRGFFCLNRMRQLPSARACQQQNVSPTESSSS